LVPVAFLALAVVMSAAVGLRLSNDASARSVADELGCERVSSSHPQTGVTEETCSYHGNVVVILSLSNGQYALYPPDVPNNLIIGPRGKDVVIGCESRQDCVKIQQKLGGDLTSGPTLGLSLVVG
jgi:hypothetical protein